MTVVRNSLQQIISARSSDPAITGVLLGGSCAKGEDDEVSDIDLWIESDNWNPSRLGGMLLAGRIASLGGLPFFHGVDRSGTIVDLMIGPEPWPHYVRQTARDLQPDLSGEGIAPSVFTDFWINSYKHRKPLYRGLDGMVAFGLHHDRMFLLRIWALTDSGIDPGDAAFTIHGMTPLVRTYANGNRHREELLGLPARNRHEMLDAVRSYRDEVLGLMPCENDLTRLVYQDPIFNSFCEQ